MGSRSIKVIISTTTCLMPAYEIAEALPDGDFDKYVEAVESWLLLKRANAGVYVKEVMRAFGMGGKLLVPPGEEDDRGNFFVVRKGEDEKLSLTRANGDDIDQARFLVCTGIDTSGKNYLINYMGALRGALPDFNEQTTVIYHPHAPAKIRAEAYQRLVRDHSYYPDGAKRLIDVFSVRRAKPIVYIGHSYGGINKQFADNADSVDILREINGRAYPVEAERISQEIRALGEATNGNSGAVVFGTMPLWGISDQLPPRKKNHPRIKHIEEIKTLLGGPEIYIMAVDDILPYLTEYGRKAIKLNAALADKNIFSAYHHPENLNKIFVVLAPGLVPAEISGKINFGGHGLLHYLEVIGLGPEPRNVNGELQKVKLAALRILNNDPTLKQEPLAKQLGAIPLDKANLSNLEVDRSSLIAALVAELVKEGKAWAIMAKRKNIDPTHPFLKGR